VKKRRAERARIVVQPAEMQGFFRNPISPLARDAARAGLSHRAAWTGAALAGVALAALLALLTLPACNECDSSIDPVKCTDLCEQDPPHRDCAQCTGDTKDGRCPQCQGPNKAPGCSNADGGTGGISGSGGTGGSGGSGGDAGTGGTGGVVGGNGGMTGGSGGVGGEDAGPLPVNCMTNDNCDFRVPLCDSEGKCAPCATDAVCIETDKDDRNICDTDGAQGLEGSCVECRSGADCNPESETPHCFEGKCAECETHADCSGDLTKPQCNAGVCGECTEDINACAMHGARDICDLREPDATSTRGQCIECLTDSNCPNDRPQCGADGICGLCDQAGGAAACSGRMDGDIATPFCNTHPDRTTTGLCVQCVGDFGTNASDETCDDEGTHFSCNRDLGRCTNTEVHVLQPCQECVADSECDDDTYLKCVPYPIDGVSPTKSYCFLDRTLPPTLAACDATRKPFINQQNVTSIDGRESQYCMLATSSCEAYRDALVLKDCMASDAQCGLGDPDVDGINCIGTMPSRCTYRCTSSDQCPPTQPTCSTGGYCRP
jgi:hypothetical protein